MKLSAVISAIDLRARKPLTAALYIFNVALSGCFLALSGWYGGLALRQHDADLPGRAQVYSFLIPFFNPLGSWAVSYIWLALCAAAYFLFLYFRRRPFWLMRKMAERRPSYLLACAVSDTVAYFLINPLASYGLGRMLVAAGLFAVSAAQVFWFRPPRENAGFAAEVSLSWEKLVRRMVWYGAVLSLFIVVCEPLRLALKPRLANEYQAIYTRTIISRHVVENKAYISNLIPDTLAADRFLKLNAFEHEHAQMARGQINHIGQILNPLNEYLCGKPANEIYTQYGLGFTFLYKRLMDLFGGISIENYYKCHSLHTVYYLLLGLLLLYTFRRDKIYAAGAFGMCGFAISSQYYGFLLGPGASPAIHGADLFALFFLLRYFEAGRMLWAVAAVAAGAAGVLLNFHFGFLLLAAVAAALAVYSAEKHGMRRAAAWSLALAAVAAALLAYYRFILKPYDVFGSFFLNGMLCISPPGAAVKLAIIYLAVSYGFALVLRGLRSPEKYFYLAALFYNQALLAYFFNSGNTNHLMHSYPFMGLQLFLMLHIAAEQWKRPAWKLAFSAVAALLVIVQAGAAAGMYRSNGQRARFWDNFRNHQNYLWRFERAHILSTIDPLPLEASVDLIHKYAPAQGEGILISSRYDNLLPFLAQRRSLLPYYDMSNYLITPEHSGRALLSARRARPDILFADADIDQPPSDAWRRLDGRIKYWTTERDIRFAKQQKLRELFEAASAGYRKVETAGLLAVYRRVR
ncbi:MAG: hypothetical protein WC421_08625 [Elusimicrobiales bacterium]